MGNCTKGSATAADPPTQKKNPTVENGANRDRITTNDQAILDIKGRVRKLKNYEEKLAG